jgi:hypothetical protein
VRKFSTVGPGLGRLERSAGAHLALGREPAGALRQVVEGLGHVRGVEVGGDLREPERVPDLGARAPVRVGLVERAGEPGAQRAARRHDLGGVVVLGPRRGVEGAARDHDLERA